MHAAKTLHQLAGSIPSARIVGSGDPTILGLTIDSRKVVSGGLFAALVGADFDGHAFATRAYEAGAAAILCERVMAVPIPQIVVPDSRASLAALAADYYDHPSHELRTIGLTGTDGKTTTGHIVENILQVAGHTTGMIGTIGVKIGRDRQIDLGHQTTPESHLVQGYLREMVDSGVDTAIVEATSHGLAMHRLDGIRFDMAGVTNITHEHLEYHKTWENYRRAKAMLVERTASNRGIVVLNADDPGAASLQDWSGGAEVMWYSMEGKPTELQASNVVASNDGTEFDLHMANEVHRVKIPMIGAFNVANSLCAAGLALGAGVEPTVIAEALQRPVRVPGRLYMIESGQPYHVVVDYAHTPESLRKILTLLKTRFSSNRVIVVSGSAGERDIEKRPLQGAVCATLADFSIFTSEDPRMEDADRIIADIANGARAAGAEEGKDFAQITDRREAIDRAFSLAAAGDCVLLAGKGHETSIIWGREERPWDEAAVATALLAERGYVPADL